jgi:hypothetical protein
VGAVTARLERALGGLGAALEWLEETYEEARQSLIDGAVVSAVLLTSLALLPYVDGGGLIVAFAIIGVVQAGDLVGRTGRDLARRVRRAPPRALRE